MLYEDASYDLAEYCPDSFIRVEIRTRHLYEHWNVLACLLHHCFDGKKGGIDQISIDRWMMMIILHNQLNAQENLFNWGKYAFNKFVSRVKEFEPKIV